ncbi:MAG: tetratricopeptide repeat protein [Bdellovibrionales bacterium]
MVQLLNLILILGFSQLVKAQVQGLITIQNDTSHLELSGKNQWSYQIKENEEKITLEVDSLAQDSVNKILRFKSPHIKKIQVKQGAVPGKDLIEFNLTSKDVEFFDYLTDQPSRLIVDFYQNSTVQKSENTNLKVPKSTAISKSVRKPANDNITIKDNGNLSMAMAQANHGLFDGADPDFERFAIKDYEIKEESIIKSRDRFYIPFPWLFETPKQWKQALATPTIYQVTPRLDDENKQMRLLEKLYTRNRNLVFLQTSDWFLEKFPNTQYGEMIAYMKADVLDRIYQESKTQVDFTKSLQAYREALEKFPESELAEKVSLSIGIKLYEQKDYLASLRAFNQHIENAKIKSKSKLSRELAGLGVALNYMQLKKFDDAKIEFEKVSQKSEFPEVREEASYRLGDLYVQTKRFNDAIQSYTSAQKEYPKAQTRFPNSFFNKAEAQFWLGNYRMSLESFREYLKRFPSDAHAPLALTRIGENLEILGADRNRVMGTYLEAYFRYGESLNASVARIRMTASKMKTMKPKEVELAAQEILDLSRKIDFVDADKLATILISEGYNERGEFDKTLKLLIDYYQQHPLMSQREQFSKRIVSAVNQKMRESVEKKDFIETLKTHQKYSDVWLKNSDRLDTRYFVGAAFEQAGAPQQAENYYREVLNRLNSIQGTNKEKEIRVVQQLPSSESLQLRLSKSLFAQKKYQEAFEALRQIKTATSLTDDEQIERVSLSVDLLMEKEDLDSSKRFVLELLKNWSGIPEKMIEPYYKLAQVEVKSKQFDEAIRSLKRIDDLVKDSEGTNREIYFKALNLWLEIAETRKDENEIVLVSEKLLAEFEGTRPISSIRYKLGEVYAKSGRFKKAEEVWNQFKGPQSEFWSNLAKEQIKHDSWNVDYKKYRSRIPAMSKEEAN